MEDDLLSKDYRGGERILAEQAEEIKKHEDSAIVLELMTEIIKPIQWTAQPAASRSQEAVAFPTPYRAS